MKNPPAFPFGQESSLFCRGFTGIPEAVQEPPVSKLTLLVQDMAVNSLQRFSEREHVVIPDPDIGSPDGSQEVKFRAIFQFVSYLRRRETFVRDYDPVPDVVVANEGFVRTGVDAVPREYLGTDRFHFFNVIRVKN